MAGKQEQQDSPQQNVSYTPNSANIGLNLENIISQVRPGMLTFSLNSIKENFDGNSISFQNEQANEHCLDFPAGYKVIGSKNIIQKGITVFWLANPSTGDSEIGKSVNTSCLYESVINSPCLGLDINFPILKAEVKVTNCSTEVYWTDGNNGRRFIDLDNLPFKTIPGLNPCDDGITAEIDCNKLLVQPNFSIPELVIESVHSDGENQAGTYQFAIQYSNALSEGYTSFYSVTDPLPLFDITKITEDFNYNVGRSINVRVSNLDTTGYYDYFNLAVIKTVNNIASVQLVGTFQITGKDKLISYTGQNKEQIRLSIEDIFQKFPVYEKAKDITVAQDVLIWDQLTTQERISYQKIANQLSLNWETWRANGNKTYAKELNAVYLRGYMRDEIYPLELVLLLANGWQTDGFHIPNRVATADDLIPVAGDDVIPDNALDDCSIPVGSKPKWQVYNTGCLLGYTQEFTDFMGGQVSYPCPHCPPVENTNPSDPKCYEGPYQYGCMAYWESTDTYPCDESVWGELAGKPIRHPKFPDSLITHIHDNQGYVYPIGIRIDVQQIKDAINNSSLSQEQKDKIVGFKIVRGNRANNKSVVAKGLIHNIGKYSNKEGTCYFPNYPYNDLRPDPFIATQKTANDSGKNQNIRINGFGTDESKQRYTLHSPDTSFYQPYLGNILKLETVEFGQSKGQYLEVLKHARYKFLSEGSYVTALVVGVAIGIFSATVGVSDQIFDGTAAFAAFNTFKDIVEKLIPKKNFVYQYNSIGEYTDFKNVQNSGNKQRFIDLSTYLAPGKFGIGDVHNVNNYQRESSVYLRTSKTLPFPSDLPGVQVDESRWIPGDEDCDLGVINKPISSYYASVKKHFDNQYGQIYSYETIDTGFQFMYEKGKNYNERERYFTVFGGDVFINRFAYKSKVPFFIDNRVGQPDESDVFYDELSNIGYSIFWLSTDIRADDSGGSGGIFQSILDTIRQFFGVKVNNFDCPSPKFFYQLGKMYLFAYGIPYFYCESEVNVDMRQAFNTKEGDFFPRMSSDIPNDWLQEINTTIAQDNSYWYNKTYSKQNKENFFAHIPEGFDFKKCREEMPFRAIFSEKQEDLIDYRRNNWLIYKPVSKFDFPQNYGMLTSLEGVEDNVVIARFENKSLMYNTMPVALTSVGQVYLGQSLFSQNTPPRDFADSDLGYTGSQHKFFLRTEYGHISIDARRGQVFLLTIPKGYYLPQAKEISGEGLNKFLTEYLDFDIQKAFPSFPIDNHFNGAGLHGVYDTKYNRLIFTKLDYSPNEGVTYDGTNLFAQDGTQIELGDPNYFCNSSFTLSYDFDAKTWISFHSYLPNFYTGEANYFFTGINTGDQSSMWRHNTSLKFNSFYGKTVPYIIEYPFSYKYNDEILQSIKDYTKAYQYSDLRTYIETDDVYFSKFIGWNNQQSTGVIKLTKKPKNNLQAYGKYPIYNSDSKEILYTKSDNFYNFNTMWGLTKSAKSPIWIKSCESLSLFKELNQANCDYSKRSFHKDPIRAKDLKCRFILDDRDDTKLVSNFIITETQQSYK